jgi:hypothetical protein
VKPVTDSWDCPMAYPDSLPELVRMKAMMKAIVVYLQVHSEKD